MKFFSLKEIPNGTPAGRVFEASEDEGRVLVSVGAARALTEAEIEGHASTPPHKGRSYRRRDLAAEETKPGR